MLAICIGIGDPPSKKTQRPYRALNVHLDALFRHRMGERRLKAVLMIMSAPRRGNRCCR
jgi:hypothetical protein